MANRAGFGSVARGLVWAVIAVFGLAACQSPGFSSTDANLTPAQRELRAEAERFNQTVAEGAVVGAIGGALIGALVSNNRLAGAAIGAAAGAAVGAGAGYFVASQNEQYASSEDRLNAEISAARQDVLRYQRAVASTQRVVDQHKANIASLNAQYRSGRITAAQYRTQVATAQGDLAAIQALISQNQQSVQAYDQEITRLRREGTNASEMVNARNEMASRRQQLQAQYDDLLRAVNSAAVPPSSS